MKQYSSIIAFLIIMACASCRTHRFSDQVRFDALPGTIALSPGLFIDNTEITNYSYLEFYWWTKRVYGDSSAEFKEVIPMEFNWYDFGESYYSFGLYYFMHAAYRDYPMVNITYQQAKLFCQWRSDRVMEFHLIRRKIITHVPNPHRDSCFTIERYFTGKYRGVKPDPSLYYPYYDLPDSVTFINALRLSDSLWMVNAGRIQKSSTCYKNAMATRCYETVPDKHDTIPYGPEPTLRSYCSDTKRFRFRKINTINHLLGNVREMTNIPGVSFGGSYKDSCAVINRNYFQKEKRANCYTGFRCLGTYKKWETK